MNVRQEARRIAETDLDAAVLWLLQQEGENTAAGLCAALGLELTATRRVAGRLRSLESRRLVRGFTNGFVNTTSWIATKEEV